MSKFNLKIQQKLCVYVDLTFDLVPFYVGQGSHTRVNKAKRNKKHSAAAQKYGHIRVIVLESNIDSVIDEMEITLINDCQTQYYRHLDNKFACNFTDGGKGARGHKLSIKHATKYHNRSKENQTLLFLMHSRVENRQYHISKMPRQSVLADHYRVFLGLF